MNLAELLDEARRRVPPDAPVGTRWKGGTVVTAPDGTHRVAAAARIDVQGRRREQYWFDGARVERAVLLRLTCAERECPHAVQVRAQWVAFRRRDATPAAADPRPQRRPPTNPLMAEVAITLGPHRLTARPARFPCFTPCPNGAHPPLMIEKAGFDLFDGSDCLAGGVVESHGVRRPRIPTVAAAEAYAWARHLETLAALGIARLGPRRRPPPSTGTD
jgi:hypothetical protein